MPDQPLTTSRLSAPAGPKLSIICTGRNDDRAPDQYERLISLQRTIAHALRNVSFEFLFVEWNPDPDVPYLGDALYLDQAQHYVVTREAHKRLVADASMSTRDGKPVKGERAFLLNHANNVGLKHARGEWVLITNLDDLFPVEFGELLEKGESGALALGIHPHWSYNLLIRYRRAQRSTFWKRCKTTIAWLRRTAKRTLRIATWPLRLAKRTLRFVVGPGTYSVRRALVPHKYFVRLQAHQLLYRVGLGLHMLKMPLRAIVIRLLGGPADYRRERLSWRERLANSPLIHVLAQIPPVIWAAHVVGLLATLVVLIVRGVRHPRATLRRTRLAVRRRMYIWRQTLRHRARVIAKAMYDFIFSPRVDWNVGRVKLTPGTLYRVRRQHVSDTFARRGADAPSIEQYLAEVEAESIAGPWNNHFPWTWACGDFLLMDYATWKRIGGFPQQIGQLHADSVTIFRIVAEGCRVALLDWNIYHMDHDDRFDAVPYVEYDFENVHRYFGPGWTRVESTLVERSTEQFATSVQGGNGVVTEPFLVGRRHPVAIGEESA